MPAMPRFRSLSPCALALLWFALPLAAAAPSPIDPLQPASAGGIATIDRDLAKLQVHERLLVIGAHPDDEDTSLLALVSRGQGGEAAYLALSRGEGGQNLIGGELGVPLGLLRTRELLAARRIDGGRQFFTRAYDFGYTRSLDETLALWPKEVLLEDVVRVIRRFRPQVVVSIFPADGGGGHGQHQAAGVVAHEAFRLAGDASAFPALASEGLTPWQPQALYRSTWFDKDKTTLVLATGGLDPLTGKSIYQLAMESRSQHRSQDMGRLQELGSQETRVGWVQGGAGESGAVLFAGIDTRLRAIALLLPDGKERAALWADLERVEAQVAQARARLVPSDPGAALAPLRESLSALRAARARLGKEKAILGAREAGEMLDEKIEAAERACVGAAGIAVDAWTDRSEIAPGEPFKLTLALWNAGREPMSLRSVEAVSADGWRLTSAPTTAQEIPAGGLVKLPLEAMAPAGTPPTAPYFLARPMQGGQGTLYDWSAAPPEARGEPMQAPPLVLRVAMLSAGEALAAEREVVSRRADQAIGEVRRPLRAVPALEVALSPDLLVWPIADSRPRKVEVTLASHAAAALTGRVELAMPKGWPAVAPVAFTLPAGERSAIALDLVPPKAMAAGSARLEASAVVASGVRYAVSLPLVDYPHVRPTPRPLAASATLAALDLRLPPLRRVGYVRGAADRVPELLGAVGVPVALLAERDLAEGDLSQYDAIVVGSRAYETDPALRAANPRLLDFARRGGLLLVQYQQYPYLEGGFAPLAFEIARPHDRITDETAPPRLLDATSAAFSSPNALSASDWQGWVQERGLYFAHTWDPAYRPLLEFTDPGQPAQQGGLLVAHLGKGTYIYTGLAFFRQLPAGVPGAYRLFANLLGLRGDAVPARAASPGARR
jgi:LmbE family N-acetylglucosaminyl deacetylase